MVQFKKKNLLEPFGDLGTFNLILCRYVLIYQDSIRKKMIIEKMENSLLPNGLLILGASESAFGLSKVLNQNSYEGAIFYQKL
jgi:chemotaxis protein methyltransferase CheR